MDPTNILYPPNRFAREEAARRFDPVLADIYRNMTAEDLQAVTESRPDEPEHAAERLAEALLPNLAEAHALRTAATRFAERNRKAAARPLKVHRTLEWQSATAAEFVRLERQLRELTKAHTAMVHAARKWREAPGFGDGDANLIAALNGMAGWLEEVKTLLEIDGRSRSRPEGAGQ